MDTKDDAKKAKDTVIEVKTSRKKVTIKRTNKNTKCRVLWYVTCNLCHSKTYLYHTGYLLSGGSGEITFCDSCMKKYHLTYKGAVEDAYIE